jgi:asparagine synthase (glutamine-hydrolysing)
MCGIISLNFKPKEDLFKITQLMKDRGPDNTSIYNINQHHFGHTRLSVLDLSTNANQPMVFNNIVLVFNGEIYNYKELIKNENLECTTLGDSEVIIRLYEKYGVEFLNKLNGAFAFSLYDSKKDIYFCARDRYAKKPLYYYNCENNFVVSSMLTTIIKSIGFTPKLNKIALSQYLQYFSPIDDNTFYTGIKKLPAASFLLYKNNKLEIKKYYKINTKKSIFSENEAIEKIENTLLQSIETRLVSDVEIASLLSGGIDSSLISSMYSKLANKKIQTFSIGYESNKKYCELPYAKILSSHINSYHNEIVLNKKIFIESLDEVFTKLEEPHSDPASIPLDYLCKHIKKQNIKTVFSGEGGDELFLGYDNYAKFDKFYKFKNSLNNEQKEFMKKNLLSSVSKNNKEGEYIKRLLHDESIYKSFGEIFTYNQKKSLFKKVPTFKCSLSKNDHIDYMSLVDIKIWLGDALLTKVDKITMGNSVETRTPFLDFNLVDLSFKIKNDIKLGDTNKYLLKKIANKYIPKKIVNRPKKGFNSPYNEWLQEEYKDDLLNTVLKANKLHELFNETYVQYIYEESKNNKLKLHFYALWHFSVWYLKTYE